MFSETSLQYDTFEMLSIGLECEFMLLRDTHMPSRSWLGVANRVSPLTRVSPVPAISVLHRWKADKIMGYSQIQVNTTAACSCKCYISCCTLILSTETSELFLRPSVLPFWGVMSYTSYC